MSHAVQNTGLHMSSVFLKPTEIHVHRDTDTDKYTWTLLTHIHTLIIQSIIYQNRTEDSKQSWPTKIRTCCSTYTHALNMWNGTYKCVLVLLWLLTLHIKTQSARLKKTYKCPSLYLFNKYSFPYTYRKKLCKLPEETGKLLSGEIEDMIEE